MKFGSLFAGIGGLDLGLERAGMECAWQVENDLYAMRVLGKQFPYVRKFRDIRAVDPVELEDVDLVCGGFPCQDISVVGKRKGLEGERSGLWTEFYRIVEAKRPNWVLIENVHHMWRRWVPAVRRALHQIGYASLPIRMRACDFGAPHKRARTFIVAHADSQRLRVEQWRTCWESWREVGGEEAAKPDPNSTLWTVADAHSKRREAERASHDKSWKKSQRIYADRHHEDVWGHWTAEPGVLRVADGIPNRMDRLRTIGNAVVPQIAELLGLQIMHYEYQPIQKKELSMEPMILFSDLHLKPESEETCFKVLEYIRGYAVQRKISLVGFLGDFWHMRYHVPVYLLNRVYEELRVWRANGLRIAMLPGNHDQVDMVGRNALEVFQAFDNIAVMTEPGELPAVPGVFWIPFRRDPEDVKVALATARHQKCPVVCAHLPIRGALQNNMHADEDGIPVGMFRGFRKVFLGHYHKRQEFVGGLAAYIGSPYQTRADEWGQDKGFVVWNGSQLEWVTMQWGKRYHRFEGAPSPAQMASVQPGDSVKVMADTEADAEQIRKLYKFDGGELVVESRTTHLPTPRLVLGKGTSLFDYACAWVGETLEAYCEDFHIKLEAKELLETFEEIWGAA